MKGPNYFGPKTSAHIEIKAQYEGPFTGSSTRDCPGSSGPIGKLRSKIKKDMTIIPQNQPSFETGRRR